MNSVHYLDCLSVIAHQVCVQFAQFSLCLLWSRKFLMGDVFGIVASLLGVQQKKAFWSSQRIS